jgi:hypothetical protein
MTLGAFPSPYSEPDDSVLVPVDEANENGGTMNALNRSPRPDEMMTRRPTLTMMSATLLASLTL